MSQHPASYCGPWALGVNKHAQTYSPGIGIEFPSPLFTLHIVLDDVKPYIAENPLIS